MDLNARLQVRQDTQQRVQRAQMEVIREALDDTLHEILLGDGIFAADYLIHDASQHTLLHTYPAPCQAHGIQSMSNHAM